VAPSCARTVVHRSFDSTSAFAFAFAFAFEFVFELQFAFEFALRTCSRG
jgi:hypothetical protein